jgi:hypothetical protein
VEGKNKVKKVYLTKCTGIEVKQMILTHLHIRTKYKKLFIEIKKHYNIKTQKKNIREYIRHKILVIQKTCLSESNKLDPGRGMSSLVIYSSRPAEAAVDSVLFLPSPPLISLCLIVLWFAPVLISIA